jgi:hypothetical protein
MTEQVFPLHRQHNHLLIKHKQEPEQELFSKQQGNIVAKLVMPSFYSTKWKQTDNELIMLGENTKLASTKKARLTPTKTQD